jgi:hypothetical protein
MAPDRRKNWGWRTSCFNVGLVLLIGVAVQNEIQIASVVAYLPTKESKAVGSPWNGPPFPAQLPYSSDAESDKVDYLSIHRRQILLQFGVASVVAGGWLFGGDSAASAVEDSIDALQVNKDEQTATSITKRPFAPPEALLPATRVKWTIDRSVELAKEIKAHPNDGTGNQQRQSQLTSFLLTPGNYMRKNPTADNSLVGDAAGFLPGKSSIKKYEPAKAYLDTYDTNRKRLPLVFQPGALLVQSGEIDSWRRLKRQEAVKESQDEVRAALNTYTQALTYRADAYLLTVSTQERSKMVREDRLPDTKQVIASDMGMRYLYRNQLLTSMADVKAELEYQMRQQNKGEEQASDVSTIDVSDLLPLLLDAQTACETWFGLIDPEQIREATEIVERESRT